MTKLVVCTLWRVDTDGERGIMSGINDPVLVRANHQQVIQTLRVARIARISINFTSPTSRLLSFHRFHLLHCRSSNHNPANNGGHHVFSVYHAINRTASSTPSAHSTQLVLHGRIVHQTRNLRSRLHWRWTRRSFSRFSAPIQSIDAESQNCSD